MLINRASGYGVQHHLKNIFAISWVSGLLVEETWVPGENHRHVSSH